jgi:hypothetical protein
MNKKETLRQEAITWLRKVAKLKAGTTIYCQVKRVSRSGMSRIISVHVVWKGRILTISSHVADVLGWGYSDYPSGVRVSGCGMDMGFHLVYCLGHAMFPKGYKPNKNTIRSTTEENGVCKDGGYAFNYTWI